MGAQGTTTIDFGAFPGKSDTSVDVTGQSGFTASSLAEAWVYPVATADHSVDEHLVDPPRVIAAYQADGTIRIYGFNASQINESTDEEPGGRTARYSGGKGTRVYGRWTVGWCWN